VVWRLKDKFFSFLILNGINISNIFKRFGKVLQFDLDSKNRKLFLKMLLEGEDEPITFSIDFDIKQKDGNYFITLESSKCSKKWLDTLINDFILNREFQIPKEHIKYLSLLKLI